MEQTDTAARLSQLEHRVNVLNRLAEISLVLNSTADLEPLLGFVMDSAADITGAEGASVLLWDAQLRQLQIAATSSAQNKMELVGQIVPLEGSIAGTIMLEKRMVTVNDTRQDPRHYNKVDENVQFQTRSLLGVPMTSKDRVIGVLEVVNKRQLPWTDDDRDYLSVLAAQAAVAIEGAQLVAALQKANQELSELDKLKNDFIAIASHELRTPLGVLLGYAGFLKDEAQGQAGTYIEKVLASGLQLRRIIDDLMNLRFLQQRPDELNREDIPLAEVIEDAIQDVLNLVEAQGHKLDLQLPPDNLVVNVDRIRAAMALTNVLNNAIRFTPAGGSIRVRAEQRSLDEVWIQISDDGIGIADDQLERIFEKFYQVEDHMTRKHGGLGIGLSIAKALVEVHGGRIWATSPGANQGATITIALPVAAGE